MKNRWYDMTFEEVAEVFETDVKNGLDKNSVTQRRKKYGPNTVYSLKKQEETPYITRAVSNLSILLLALVALIHGIILKEYEVLAIPCLLVISMLIIFYAYKKSLNVLESNAKDSIPLAKVLRGGELKYVRHDKIVPGDIINVSAGDIIPCDARLIESTDLMVMEKGIGKDNISVKKDASFRSSNTLAPEERVNMLFTFGVVLKGRGKAIAVATGKSTHVSMRGEKVLINANKKPGVLGDFEKYSTAVSIIICTLVMALTVLSMVFKMPLGVYNSFFLLLSLLVASMCEFLPMFANIILSCGIFGAGERKRKKGTGVMIKNSAGLELLKDVDCIFFHKESLFAESDIHAEPCRYSGSEIQNRENFSHALKCLIISRGLYGAARLNDNNDKNENIYSAEDEVLINELKARGIYNKRLDEDYPATEHKKYVFKGSIYQTTTVKKDKNNVFYASGNALNILKYCMWERVNGQVQKITPERRRELEAAAAEKIRGGSKVLGAATNELRGEKINYRSPAELFSEMIFEGMAAVSRPVIQGAVEYIKECRTAGIKVIMVCDDINRGNIMLARNIGVVADESECTDINALSNMSTDMIQTNIPMYNLYQGLSIPQLKYIVSYMKGDMKKTVAYLGRRLSHLGLITEADVGMAELLTVTERSVKKGSKGSAAPTSAVNHKDTSRGGSEALKFAADVALSKPDTEGSGGFNSAIHSIISARNIWNNLYLMCAYMTLIFSSRMVLVIFSMISGVSLITPMQLLFMGVICDLAAIIMIAFERSDKKILSRKLMTDKGADKKEKKAGFLSKRNIKDMGIYCALSILGTLVSMGVLFGIHNFNEWSVPTMRTITFVSAIAFQLALIVELLSPKSIFSSKVKVYNIYPFYIVLIGGIIALSMVFPVFGRLLGISVLGVYEWITVLVPPLALIAIFEVYKLLRKK